MNKENKKYIIETFFLRECLKHNISLNEFLLLMYFDNEYETTFDVKSVSKALSLNEKDVLTAFGSLLDKKLITISSVKNESGKFVDKISLDNVYNDIKTTKDDNDDKNKKQDFFAKFQASFGHSLSGMDYEIINAWLTAGFTEELILGALGEANYNGAVSLRYIDRVLYEWKNKGFKSMNDVKKHMQSRDDDNESSLFETQVMEYNWLDEE